MERNLFAKFVPKCSLRIAPVDQYNWPVKDNAERICENGIQHPIYSSTGDISYMLPLENYPKDYRKIHHEIPLSSNKPWFNARIAKTFHTFETNYNRSAAEHPMKEHYQRSHLYEGLYDTTY